MPTYQTIIHYLKSGLSIREIAKLKIVGRHKCGYVQQIAKNRGWLEAQAIIPSESELKLSFEKDKKYSPVTALTPHKEMLSEWIKDGYQSSTMFNRLKQILVIQDHIAPFSVLLKILKMIFIFQNLQRLCILIRERLHKLILGIV